jgi:hypothetical protein
VNTTHVYCLRHPKYRPSPTNRPQLSCHFCCRQYLATVKAAAAEVRT